MLYLLLAEGFEETEAVATFDVISRCNIGIKTVNINIGNAENVRGSHGISLKADIGIDEVDFKNIDGIILPGGMPGTLNLKNDKHVRKLIEFCVDNEKIIAAICAAPMILGHLGILKGLNATCFPGVEDDLDGAILSNDAVVRDDNIITANGAGAVFGFAAEIANYFKEDSGTRILKKMQVK
ncbi:MAG: DJ-1/PfpI family protein [Oscillospiraceae bacterium]